MCELCDGKSYQELLIDQRARIDELGWLKVAVGYDGDGDGTLPWIYTLGLIETYDHPELIVFGLGVELADHLINAYALHIEDGISYAAGDRLELEELGWHPLHLLEVHPRHFAETSRFAMWNAHYHASDLTPRALQIALPASLACECHQQPDLSKPPTLGNRALRRARARSTRRTGLSPHLA